MDISQKIKKQNFSNPHEPLLNAYNDLVDFLNSNSSKQREWSLQFRTTLIIALYNASAATFIQGFTSAEAHSKNIDLFMLALYNSEDIKDDMKYCINDAFSFLYKYDPSLTRDFLYDITQLSLRLVKNQNYNAKIPYSDFRKIHI